MRNELRRSTLSSRDIKIKKCLGLFKKIVCKYLFSSVIYARIIMYFTNMNTQLEKLFSQYNLSEKDRYEIRQIYSLLPLHKQRNLVENFEELAIKLKKIEEEIKSEKDLLIGEEVDNIRQLILSRREQKMTKSQISDLQKEI